MACINQPPENQGWICPDYRDDAADPQVLRDALAESLAAGWVSELEAAELWPSHDTSAVAARDRAGSIATRAEQAGLLVDGCTDPVCRAVCGNCRPGLGYPAEGEMRAVDARYAELRDQYADPQRWVGANGDAWAAADVDADGW